MSEYRDGTGRDCRECREPMGFWAAWDADICDACIAAERAAGGGDWQAYRRMVRAETQASLATMGPLLALLNEAMS